MGCSRRRRGCHLRFTSAEEPLPDPWCTPGAANHPMKQQDLATAWAAIARSVPSCGPRTTEQLDGYLAADCVDLPQMLDRIDDIVAPGVTPAIADNDLDDVDLRHTGAGHRPAPPAVIAAADR